MEKLSTTRWHKSSRSGANGCVEVLLEEGRVAVRDAKDPSGPILHFTAHEWQAFLDGARDGEFDLPS
jgi:hypothetical protein